MPHQCTECGRTFPDGSKEMLSGCPDCGGNKFQFRPAGTSPGTENESSVAAEGSDPVGADEPDSTSTAEPDSTSTAEPDSTSTAEPDSTTVDGSETNADGMSEPESRPDPTAGTPDPTTAENDTEDTAQASARSDVVSPDELDRAANEPSSSTGTDPDERPGSTETADSTGSEDAMGSDERTGPRPDVDELRDELNEQFESIRIVSPGKYELNLMELYDRQEYIISLQEDGKYVIEMPDAWGITDE